MATVQNENWCKISTKTHASHYSHDGKKRAPLKAVITKVLFPTDKRKHYYFCGSSLEEDVKHIGNTYFDFLNYFGWLETIIAGLTCSCVVKLDLYWLSVLACL